MDYSDFETVLLEIGRGNFHTLAVEGEAPTMAYFTLTDEVFRSLRLSPVEAEMVAKVVNDLSNTDRCRVRPFTAGGVGYVAVRITHDLHRRRW